MLVLVFAIVWIQIALDKKRPPKRILRGPVYLGKEGEPRVMLDRYTMEHWAGLEVLSSLVKLGGYLG